MNNSHEFNGADFLPAGPCYRYRPRCGLLDALLAEALAPGNDGEMEAAE